jgi:hypothetical protein
MVISANTEKVDLLTPDDNGMRILLPKFKHRLCPLPRGSVVALRGLADGMQTVDIANLHRSHFYSERKRPVLNNFRVLD